MSNSKEQTYSISINPHSKGEFDKWRVFCDDSEDVHYTHDVIINTKVFTSKDWVAKTNKHKHNIKCSGVLSIEHGVACINEYKSKSKDNPFLRHILKTISYRFLATTVTVIGVYSIGASLELSMLVGVGELVVKPIVYFIHERIWFRVKMSKK